MVVHDLDIVCVPGSPPKTDTPLVVHANAVLAGTIATEFLQTIPRWNSKVFQGLCGVEGYEFS